MATSKISNWENKCLSQLGFIGRGKSKHRPRNDKSLYGGEYPFVQTSDIKHSNFYVNSYSQTYNEIGLKQSKLWDKDTLCITIAANIAETALLGFPACFPDSIVGFVADPKKSNVKFIKYALDFAKRNFQKTSKGTAQDNLSLEKIDNLKINVPDANTQIRIASVLSAYDDLIEVNDKRIKVLEEMAQLLYTEWFVKFKFPGYEKVKMVDSGTEYGKIPEGWEVAKVGDKFLTILGGTPSRNKSEYWENGNIPWINSGTVNNLRITEESELITKNALEKSATKIMPKRTTLLAITGATLGQVSLTEIECCANQSVVGIHDKEGLLNEYVYLRIKNEIKSIIALAGGGAQQHINKDIINNKDFLIPEEKLIKKFSRLIVPLFDDISALIFSNKNLSQIRDLIIPQLVTGRRELRS